VDSQSNTKTTTTRSATISAAISNRPNGKNGTRPEPSRTDPAAMTTRQTAAAVALCSQSHPRFRAPVWYVIAADGNHLERNLLCLLGAEGRLPRLRTGRHGAGRRVTPGPDCPEAKGHAGDFFEGAGRCGPYLRSTARRSYCPIRDFRKTAVSVGCFA
jgi:hypothetical protein